MRCYIRGRIQTRGLVAACAAQVWSVQMRLCSQKDRYISVHEPTDGWMAEQPTTGQRALRLDKGKWVLVPPASRRTTTVLKSLVSLCLSHFPTENALA